MAKDRNNILFGKSIEHMIISRMLRDGLDVFMTLADYHGIDCVVKSNNKYYDIQIKGRSMKSESGMCGSFNVTNSDNNHNLFYVLYLERLDTTFIFSYEELLNEFGNNFYKRNIKLATYGKRKGLVVINRFEKYIVNDFSRFK